MAGAGSEDEDGGGLLTPRTKGIVQHFQKQVRLQACRFGDDGCSRGQESRCSSKAL
jgi:hypothetical protein